MNSILTVKSLQMYIYFELLVPCTLAYLIGNISGGTAVMHLSKLVVSTVSGYFTCTCIIRSHCRRYRANSSHQIKHDYKASLVCD